MSSRTSSRSTLTMVPSTMSPSLKYLIVASIAARKSSSEPMSLTATCGASERVGVTVIRGLIPRESDGVVRTREKPGFTTIWCRVRPVERTERLIASENLLRLRLRQAPAHLSGYATNGTCVQPRGSRYGVQVTAARDGRQQLRRALGHGVLGTASGQVHKPEQVGRPGQPQDVLAGVRDVRAVAVQDGAGEHGLSLEAQQVAE